MRVTSFPLAIRVSFAMLILAACSDASRVNTPDATLSVLPSVKLGKAASNTVTVTAVDPWNGHRGTTVDVHFIGSGFGAGSNASFELHGVPSTKVRVNATQFISTTDLLANVTIDSDADLDRYDAVVVTLAGKKGIGTEQFIVGVEPEIISTRVGAQDITATGDVIGGISGGCGGALPVIWRSGTSSYEGLPLGVYCGGNALAIAASGTILASMSGGADGTRVLYVPDAGGYSTVEVSPAPDGARPYTGGGMNDNLEIIGWKQNPTRLYWWSSSTGWLPMQVPTNAASCQTLDAINNHGEIAVWCLIGKSTVNGYYWQTHESAPVLLPKPSGISGVRPYDINDSGVIAGYSSTSPSKALRWTRVGSAYSVEVLADKGFGASATGVAEDGSVAGIIYLNQRGTYAPAVWSPSGSYRLLGASDGALYGYASPIIQTAGGWFVGGNDDRFGLRWFVPTP